MPLLKKKALEKAPMPEFLRDDEEVFHCEMTNEIFRDYEEFAERTILCNSMVWTCSMTGRSNLTYVEALQSEENAKKSLKDFPVELRIPVLFLANKTKRTSFGDMAEDVFSYMKDRFFVGENIEACFSGNKWRDYHILQVIAPDDAEIKRTPKINGTVTERHFFPPPSLYKYDLEQLDNDDDDVIEKMIVDFTQIRRKKGMYTKEKNKLFLKQYVEQNSDGLWTIKESFLESFGVNRVKFDQIFDGPLPDFETSKKGKNVVNGKKVKQETLAKYLTKNNLIESKEQKTTLIEEMKKKELEFRKHKEELKQKAAEEKLAERRKKRQENSIITSMLKEWFKPKEDLELEDQKKLPELVEIKTKVPDKYVGDMLMVLEFVNSFPKILSTKDFFPGGFTVDVIERALIEKEVAGPLIDLLQMLLNAIFALQEEEASQTKIYFENVAESTTLNENPTTSDCTKYATLASTWSTRYQGVPLSRLPMYSLTVSEILRLHLLSSGARVNESGSRWRFQQRGGYTNEDDPGLYLRQNEPYLIKALAIHNVIQFSVGDKLKILSCLVNQLLTYADVRDIVEERMETLRLNKLELKTSQFAEKKRCTELISAKTKLKNDTATDRKEVLMELDKMDKDNERQHADYERKMSKLMKASVEHQILLGYDRAFRRYVKLESIPGLFIDPYEENPGVCLSEMVHQNSKLVDADRTVLVDHIKNISEEMNTSDKENDPHKLSLKPNGVTSSLVNETNTCNELYMCSVDPKNCIVHSGKNKIWRFFNETQHIVELICTLNRRGIRESELQQFIQCNYENLEKLISQTPGNQFNVAIEEKPDSKIQRKGKNRYEDANLGFPSSTDPIDVLHSSLTENILEMEEKISAGNLGSLKVKDRAVWRKCLTDSKYDDFDRTIITYNENGKLSLKEELEDVNSRESTPDNTKSNSYRDPGLSLGVTVAVDSEDSDMECDEMVLSLSEKQKIALECLSIALVQISYAVDSKYLRKPLGHADVKKEDVKGKIQYDILKNWQQSLLASTSYSQVFLHYGTLDSCIMWSRSALLARCRVCRRQRDSENMLLCDNCNYGQHLYCHKPKLDSIPQGEWFCIKCLREKEKEMKQLNPEPENKRKRRIFRDEDVDEEEEEEGHMDVDKGSEDELDGDESDDDDSDEIKNDSCTTCGSDGDLISCEKCSSAYHIECVEPPLRRKPRGQWTCSHCKSRKSHRDNDQTDLMMNQRRSATRARHIIHGFVKSLRGNSYCNDSDSSIEVSSSSRRSGRREAEDLPLHNAALQDLLLDVMKHKDAWPFIRPVQKNEVPDYYDVITKPMDFGTIKYKLNMGKYTCDEDFMADAVLIFENCNTYNDTDADVYKCGVKLLKVFEKKSKELGLKLPEEMQEDENRQPKSKKRRTK